MSGSEDVDRYKQVAIVDFKDYVTFKDVSSTPNLLGVCLGCHLH